MKRTQLYLDEEMSRVLSAESRRRKTTVSELVREAVAAAYPEHRPADRGAVIRRLAGVWKERSDLSDADSVVRSLRRSDRPGRFKRGTGGQVSARQRRDH